MFRLPDEPHSMTLSWQLDADTAPVVIDDYDGRRMRVEYVDVTLSPGLPEGEQIDVRMKGRAVTLAGRLDRRAGTAPWPILNAALRDALIADLEARGALAEATRP